MPGALSQKIPSINNLQLQSGYIFEIGNVGGILQNLAGPQRQLSVGGRQDLLPICGQSLRSGIYCRPANKLFCPGRFMGNRCGFPYPGGDGFIGSNTVDELVRRGHSVVVLDDLSSGKEDNLTEVRHKITFIKGSITDIEVVRKAMHDAEYVLHLAARTSVPRSVKDPIETNKINIDGTLNVLVAAKELKVKRVVFAASSSAYG